MTKKLLRRASVAVAFAMLAVPASALTLTFNDMTTASSNTPHTGASGMAELTFSDVGSTVLIDVVVTNTTGSSIFGAGATVATLTGFGFDFLSTTTASVASANGPGGLDTPLFNAAFNPFGTLDVAFADDTNFLGGNANSALGVGDSSAGNSNSVTVIDSIHTNAAALEAAMESAFAAGDLQAGLRFMQVNAGSGSDKLNYTGSTPPVGSVPLPAAAWFLLAGLGGLAAVKRRKS